jgi:hypothetical protein
LYDHRLRRGHKVRDGRARQPWAFLLAEFQARVVERHAGDLKPGQVFVVRKFGNAMLTPDEMASNLVHGLVMEEFIDELRCSAIDDLVADSETTARASAESPPHRRYLARVPVDVSRLDWRMDM